MDPILSQMNPVDILFMLGVIGRYRIYFSNEITLYDSGFIILSTTARHWSVLSYLNPIHILTSCLNQL
jgi:hypothetical protein